MKRILAVLLTVMLFVAVMPVTSLAEGTVSNGDTKVYHVQTRGSTLQLRISAGKNAAVVSQLPNGTALKLASKKTAKKDGYKWINVKTMNGAEGWVAAEYVKDNARADVATQRDGLNVRSSRNAKSPKNIKYSIPHGTKGVIIYAVNGNWAKVNWNNKGSGWASLSYLRWTRW